MAIGAFEVLHAAKALICKERRDSFVDAPDSKSWTEAPPQLEKMDWLEGPEGVEWLSNLRVTAEGPPTEMRSHGVDDLFNDENQSLGANVDRRLAMHMATKGLKALPARPMQPLPPNDLVAAPRGMTMPESPARHRLPFGHVPHASSFTVARVRHHSRSPSFDAARLTPRVPLQPGRSFSVQAPVAVAPPHTPRSFSLQAPVAPAPLMSISSFDRPVCMDSSSFQHGPPARPVRSPGSFSLGPPVTMVASRASSRGPAPRTQSRSVSRGVDHHRAASTSLMTSGVPSDNHRAASTSRPNSVRRGGTNVGMELFRDVSVEVPGHFDDVVMPDTGREVASQQSSARQTRRKPGNIFWKPPPEAAKLCAAMQIPSFVSPEVATGCARRPPVAPVVGFTSSSWFPATDQLKSYGPPIPSASVRPVVLESRPSFPSSNSFVPPARLHSGSFMPSPREMQT